MLRVTRPRGPSPHHESANRLECLLAPPARRRAPGFTPWRSWSRWCWCRWLQPFCSRGSSNPVRSSAAWSACKSTHSPRSCATSGLQQALEGLLCGQAETPERFVGTERDLRGQSTCHLAPASWVQRASLSLRDSSEAAGTEPLWHKPRPRAPPTRPASRPSRALGNGRRASCNGAIWMMSANGRTPGLTVWSALGTLPRAIALLHRRHGAAVGQSSFAGRIAGPASGCGTSCHDAR